MGGKGNETGERSEPSGRLGRGKAAKLRNPYPSSDSLARFTGRFFSFSPDFGAWSQAIIAYVLHIN